MGILTPIGDLNDQKRALQVVKRATVLFAAPINDAPGVSAFDPYR